MKGEQGHVVAVNELIVTKYVVQELTITSVEEVGHSMTGTPSTLGQLQSVMGNTLRSSSKPLTFGCKWTPEHTPLLPARHCLLCGIFPHI